LLGGGDSPHSPDDFRGAFETIRHIGTGVLAIGSAFLLSLLFSFLIVLDLPRLTESVRSLERTRLRFVYHETAETIYNFGRILGRAFEAQVLIAFVNTVLTAIGLQVLGLGEETVFLSVIVFFCSFIPVAGVFISSVPICLVSLQQYGFGHVSLCILLIWIIHMVEAYYLNPKIYGHHLRMNPVIVLMILTISGKFFHFWGLILGVPVCTYIFGHAIQYHPKDETGPL
jgi:predicted PurR-regulated permease PerM